MGGCLEAGAFGSEPRWNLAWGRTHGSWRRYRNGVLLAPASADWALRWIEGAGQGS
jgi:hypothetical protein